MSPPNENARAGEQRANQSKQSDYKIRSAEEQAKSCRDPGSITFLQSTGDYRSRMAKRFYKDKFGKIKTEPYGRQKYFKVLTALCHNIHALATQISHAEKYPYVCVVRGAPADGVDWKYALRRSKSRKDALPTLVDVPRSHMMIDIDKIPCPPATDPAVDPVDAVLYVVGLLPPEFWDVSFFWQFSSSQGMNGSDTLSLHIWFYLDKPYTNAELRRYARTTNKSKGYKLIDPALFEPAQVHYIARPRFEEGINDPLPVRSGFWPGLDDHATLNIPTVGERKPAYKAAAEYCPGLGYQGYLASIGDDKNGFRKPIISAIASYVSTNGVEGTDKVAIKTDIRAAIDAAPCGNRSQEEIERYASDAFLDDIFEWIFDREQEAARMPDAVTSLLPYYPYPAYDNADKNKAAAHMKEAIDDYVHKAVEKAVAARAERMASEFDYCNDHAA